MPRFRNEGLLIHLPEGDFMFKRALSAATIVVALIALTVDIPGAATVTIDHTKTYQTMEGFGAHGYGNFESSSFVDFIINDLGVTELRHDIPYDFEPRNDNNDPNKLELGNYAISGRVGHVIKVINATKKYGLRHIASCWSPPAWMKENTSPSCSNGAGHCGGNVKASMREEFAEFMVAYYRLIEQECGVKLYGMSIQNEPAFAEPYKSCVYTPEQYRDMLKVVGPRFEREGIDTKLFGAEDMAQTSPSYGGYINSDPDAKPYLDAYAVHGYADGVDAAPNSKGAAVWSKLRVAVIDQMRKNLWMTETSGYGTGWNAAMGLATAIHIAIHYGHASLWSWWSLDQNKLSGFSLLNGGKHTHRSLASKHYYKFVRPGDVRIGVSSDDPDVSVTAFRNTRDNNLTLVLINNGNATQMALDGEGVPAELKKYTTTSNKQCRDEGTARASSVSLDGNSVTTLVGEGYRPATVATARPTSFGPYVTGSAGGGHGAAEQFGLAGRRLGRFHRGVLIERRHEAGKGILRIVHGNERP